MISRYFFFFSFSVGIGRYLENFSLCIFPSVGNIHSFPNYSELCCSRVSDLFLRTPPVIHHPSSVRKRPTRKKEKKKSRSKTTCGQEENYQQQWGSRSPTHSGMVPSLSFRHMFLSLHSSALNASHPTGAATSPHGSAPTPVNAPRMAAHAPNVMASPVKMAGSCLVALREKYRSSIMPSLTTVHGWHGLIGGNTTGGAGTAKESVFQWGGHQFREKEEEETYASPSNSIGRRYSPDKIPAGIFPRYMSCGTCPSRRHHSGTIFARSIWCLAGLWGRRPWQKTLNFFRYHTLRCFQERKAMSGAAVLTVAWARRAFASSGAILGSTDPIEFAQDQGTEASEQEGGDEGWFHDWYERTASPDCAWERNELGRWGNCSWTGLR